MPACQDCNSRKQGKEWHAYLAQVGGPDTGARYKRIEQFFKHYKYAPDPSDLRDVAEELYAEIGSISVTLISEKIKRRSGKL